MNKIFLTSIVFLLYSMATLAQTREIVWQDEFDYEGLPNPTKWDYDVGGHGWGNNELQYYADGRLENSRVENGNLIIESRYENYMGKIYSSARLVTRNLGDWKYGYFEMRAILPTGRGTWPAFWMLPTDWEYGGWPDSGEIDIMEHVGYDPGVVHGTVHTKDYNHMIGTQVGQHKNIATAQTEYHVYACEWTPDVIRMYIDGNHYFSFNNQGSWTKWPFNKRFHILLNTAVGGNWGGVEGVDNTAFPTQFIIDYVRVYAPGSSPTGSIENDASDKIRVYPNPTQSEVFIDLSEINSSSEVEISIFDSMGKMIQNVMASDSKEIVKVDISGNSKGACFYTIKSSNTIIKRGGIMKN